MSKAHFEKRESEKRGKEVRQEGDERRAGCGEARWRRVGRRSPHTLLLMCAGVCVRERRRRKKN